MPRWLRRQSWFSTILTAGLLEREPGGSHRVYGPHVPQRAHCPPADGASCTGRRFLWAAREATPATEGTMAEVRMTLCLPGRIREAGRSYAQPAAPTVLVIQDFDGWKR